MKNMEVRIIWTCGLLVLFLKGCRTTTRKDEYVNLPDNFRVWEGSCIKLQCTYTGAKKPIDKFLWYRNASYNETISEFTGTVIYDSKSNSNVDKLFAGHVQYEGKKDHKDCTIVLRNIRKHHAGNYQVRLLGTNQADQFKWMSKNSTITVSDSGPRLKIEAPPEMEESKTVTLTCSLGYYCRSSNIALDWTNEVNGTTSTDEKDGEGASTTLTFQPSWRDHKKNITCVFEQDNIGVENKTVQLNVKYTPKNVQVLPNNATMNITKPKTLTLTCSVESSNPAVNKITWYKDNAPHGGTNNRLQVVDAGKYFCKAENNMGASQSEVVQVSVLYPPEQTVINKNQETIQEGLDIKMECSTKANPPPFRYVWYKGEEECFNHTDKWYTISKIQEGDSGSYTCLARNELGENESKELKLDVLYAPRNPKVVLQINGRTCAEEDNITFVEGDNVTFECNVSSSNPAINQITWYKDRNIVTNIVTNVNNVLKGEDAGIYRCEAANDVGRTLSPPVNVDVHYSPKGVNIEVSKTTVTENTTVKFKCKSEISKPAISSYEWYKDDVLLRRSPSDVLELRLEWTHAGKYSCKALNDVGHGVSPKKEVVVQYAPKNVTLKLITEDHVSEFMDVEFTCMGEGNPSWLRYSFYRNNVPLSYVPLSHARNTYHLNDVQIKDTGDYSCVASNSVGDGKRSNVVSLHVSYSAVTIGKFASIGASCFIILFILIFLIVRFRVRIRNAFRKKTVDDNSDASFFVLKKSRESADNMGHQMSSRNCSTDQLNYSTLNFPVPSKRRNNVPSATDDNDTTVYSVVKKVSNTPEYENIESSKVDQDDSQDEIHYSVIANLNKKAAERERDPEVEYAKLRHS